MRRTVVDRPKTHSAVETAARRPGVSAGGEAVVIASCREIGGAPRIVTDLREYSIRSGKERLVVGRFCAESARHSGLALRGFQLTRNTESGFGGNTHDRPAGGCSA
jgi:hypothetical protein